MNKLGTIQFIEFRHRGNSEHFADFKRLLIPLDPRKKDACEEPSLILQRKEKHLLPPPCPLYFLTEDGADHSHFIPGFNKFRKVLDCCNS